MVQLFDLSLCPQFKFTVKQQLNKNKQTQKKKKPTTQYELLEICTGSTTATEPTNAEYTSHTTQIKCNFTYVSKL
jgi:hypothetical protein